MSQMSASGVLCHGAEAAQSYPVGTQIAITQQAMSAKDVRAGCAEGCGDGVSWRG